MKKFFSAIVLSVLIMLAIPNAAQTKGSFEYEYPLTPESPEWSSYHAYELQEKLNIPREQVASLNTRDLLALVLEYPFIGDVYAFHTVEDGIETIRKRFDPLDELLKRDDVAEAVYSEYLDEKDNEKIKKEILEGNYDSSLKISFLEFLIEKHEVSSQFTDLQIEKIVKKAIDMESDPGIDSIFRQSDSVLKDVYDQEKSARSWGSVSP
ncbi:hypothetical protein ACQRB4_01765 [Peptoniphilaceae bacterium SGI.097]